MDWFDPAYKAGGPIRSCVNLSKMLSQQHNIYVITGNKDLGGQLLDVQMDEWVKKSYGVSVMYVSDSSNMYKILSQEVNRLMPSVIYLNGLYSKRFTLLPLILKKRNLFNPKIVVAPRGTLQKGALQRRKMKKMAFFALVKLLGLMDGVFFHATDQQEQRDIVENLKIPLKRIMIVPNVPSTGGDDIKPINKFEGSLDLVYISRLAPHKNLKFLLQRLKVIEGKVKLSVYGEIEDNYWDKCLIDIAQLPKSISVEYMGTIPHSDVIGVLSNNHFFILPTKGENFGHAIFESFAAGRPVIIGDQTPWKELEKHGLGWDISLENPEKWERSLNEAVSMGQQEFSAKCQNASEYAQCFMESSRLKYKYNTLF